jgi:hypothetical protein
MSKIAYNREGVTSGPSAVDVLRRVAELSGARNDSALARALGVSRQTLSSWRQRGNVPFEAAARFALQHDVPLDYLLLGRGSSWTLTGAVIPQLLMAIGEALIKKWIEGAAGEKLKPGSASFLHYCAVVYNRVVAITERMGNPYKQVDGEVDHLYKLLPLQAQIKRKSKPQKLPK